MTAVSDRFAEAENKGGASECMKIGRLDDAEWSWAYTSWCYLFPALHQISETGITADVRSGPSVLKSPNMG